MTLGAWQPLLDAALRGALLAGLLLVAVAMARLARRDGMARVGIVFAAGLAVQTVASLPAVERGLPIAAQAPLVAVSLGNSVLFWLFVRALFDDGFALRPWHAAPWAAAAAVGGGFCAASALLGPQAPLTVALRAVLRAVPALCTLLVVATAAWGWRVDLVERRRGIRVLVVVAGSAYALGMLAVRIGSPQGVPSPAAAMADSAWLLAMVLAIGMAVLRIDRTSVALPEHASAPDAVPKLAPAPAAVAAAAAAPAARPVADPEPPDPRLAAALERAMTVDRAYRIDDLTLGVLALKVGVPEYRLRRHIHRHLGHRNFNAYVNALRLAEVRTALSDPSRRAEGILDIALAAGFASPGPFNRAFKADTGMTPTGFRQRRLADS